jgi:hypothetical protein
MHFYQANSTDVSAEYFENEVLAINLKTGNYFSLRFSACVFWKLITEGNSFEETLDLISEHYDIASSNISEKFDHLLHQLIENQLLEAVTTVVATADTVWLHELDKHFTEPQFECYTDMQDLLLFDPIHDVDTQVGWPKKADDDTKQ